MKTSANWSNCVKRSTAEEERDCSADRGCHVSSRSARPIDSDSDTSSCAHQPSEIWAHSCRSRPRAESPTTDRMAEASGASARTAARAWPSRVRKLRSASLKSSSSSRSRVRRAYTRAPPPQTPSVPAPCVAPCPMPSIHASKQAEKSGSTRISSQTADAMDPTHWLAEARASVASPADRASAGGGSSRRMARRRRRTCLFREASMRCLAWERRVEAEDSGEVSAGSSASMHSAHTPTAIRISETSIA
mmetsp:Transcript_30116/g.97146  ORF Transcript_30116/g.97146 Transcript_30116/m.97146 type:complete len:248 (-) Transcript_30116:162-905(-)